MGFGHRHSAVTGCPNSGKRLNKWASMNCELHNCCRESKECVCEPSFVLYPFPTERKDKEARLQWARLIKRQSKKGGKLWMPKSSSQVCSKHFISGKPTKENPHSVLNLGYVAAKHAERKPPAKRIKNLGKHKKDDEQLRINKRTKSSYQPESEITANCSSQATETESEEISKSMGIDISTEPQVTLHVSHKTMDTHDTEQPQVSAQRLQQLNNTHQSSPSYSEQIRKKDEETKILSTYLVNLHPSLKFVNPDHQRNRKRRNCLITKT